MDHTKNAAKHPAGATAGRHKVIVIDDSDVDREAMAELLELAGFDVHALPSPIGSTRTARELKADVVVIDQNLPAMDGAKLVALFRGNPNLKHLRIVLVSGADEAEMVEVARQARADAFVSKRRLREDFVRAVKGSLHDGAGH